MRSRSSRYSALPGRAARVSFIGALVALAVALNVLERAVPTPLPWVRLGLANLLTLIAIVTAGWRAGVTVTLLRVIISALLFGGFLGPAFLLSLGGGLGGTAVMALMAPGAWRWYSPLAMSLAGAFAHAVSQVLVLSLLLIRTREILVLLPWVTLTSLVSGAVTGLLANLVLLQADGSLRRFGDHG